MSVVERHWKLWGFPIITASTEAVISAPWILNGMGVTMASPFMTLSFLALSVIPELKITDRGLVDVNRFELVPLGIE